MTEKSMYEQFNPLTTVAKQRFVELFQGDALDTDRWQSNNNGGTGSAESMVNAINEGYELTTGNSVSNYRSLNFNNKRQYDNTNCVMITSCRAVEATTRVMRVGFNGSTGGDTLNDYALITNDTSKTNYQILSEDVSGGTTSTTGTNAIDELFHTHKLVIGSTNLVSSFDGIQDVTKTDERPTVKLEPLFYIFNAGTAVNRSGRIRYMECWNV